MEVGGRRKKGEGRWTREDGRREKGRETRDEGRRTTDYLEERCEGGGQRKNKMDDGRPLRWEEGGKGEKLEGED